MAINSESAKSMQNVFVSLNKIVTVNWKNKVLFVVDSWFIFYRNFGLPTQIVEC